MRWETFYQDIFLARPLLGTTILVPVHPCIIKFLDFIREIILFHINRVLFFINGNMQFIDNFVCVIGNIFVKFQIYYTE